MPWGGVCVGTALALPLERTLPICHAEPASVQPVSKESAMSIAFLLLALSPLALAQTPMPKSDPALPPPDISDAGVGAAVPGTASQYDQRETPPGQYDPDPNLTLRTGPNGDKTEAYRQPGRIVARKSKRL